MVRLNRVQLCWLFFNALGIVLFLDLASDAWIEPELANVPGASAGDFIVWGFQAFPVLIVFLLLHVFLAVTMLHGAHRLWLCVVGATAAFWLVAFFLDNAHHGI